MCLLIQQDSLKLFLSELYLWNYRDRLLVELSGPRCGNAAHPRHRDPRQRPEIH